jgi:hypothetical protein
MEIEPNEFVLVGACAVRNVTVAPFASSTDPDASDTYGAMAVLQPGFSPPNCAPASGAVMTMKTTTMRRLTRITINLSGKLMVHSSGLGTFFYLGSKSRTHRSSFLGSSHQEMNGNSEKIPGETER